MPRLSWETGQYEAGVSRGVLYPKDGAGLPWNGLISVSEGFVGADRSSYYLDGIKFLETVGGRNYQAQVNAFSVPKGSEGFFGQKELIDGLRLGRQPKERFHFSYQTGLSDGYKIHLVYNVLATPTSRGYSSIGQEVTPSVLGWKLDSRPEPIPDFRPAAHVVIDSRRAAPDALGAIEAFIYGDDETDAFFPSIDELLLIFGGS